MTVLRHYIMKASEGRGADLRAVLLALAAQVKPLAGCAAVELFADPRDAEIGRAHV